MLTWLSYSEDTHSTGYLQIQSNTDGPPQGVTFYQSMMVIAPWPHTGHDNNRWLQVLAIFNFVCHVMFVIGFKPETIQIATYINNSLTLWRIPFHQRL